MDTKARAVRTGVKLSQLKSTTMPHHFSYIRRTVGTMLLDDFLCAPPAS